MRGRAHCTAVPPRSRAPAHDDVLAALAAQSALLAAAGHEPLPPPPDSQPARARALLVEAVATGLDAGVAPDCTALRLAVRVLVDQLAQQQPGRSVELRVPPFAAAQVVTGTTHTRGTPPAVVEVEPATWVLLATGRRSWAAALADGSLRARGGRSDLTPYLPLLT